MSGDPHICKRLCFQTFSKCFEINQDLLLRWLHRACALLDIHHGTYKINHIAWSTFYPKAFKCFCKPTKTPLKSVSIPSLAHLLDFVHYPCVKAKVFKNQVHMQSCC